MSEVCECGVVCGVWRGKRAGIFHHYITVVTTLQHSYCFHTVPNMKLATFHKSPLSILSLKGNGQPKEYNSLQVSVVQIEVFSCIPHCVCTQARMQLIKRKLAGSLLFCGGEPGKETT